MTIDTIEISIDGKWVRVPTLKVNGSAIITSGSWLKMAAIHDEEWLETEVVNPELYIEVLKAPKARQLGADIFTFTQKPSEATSRYKYHVEWDSVATIRLNSFHEWWERLPQETRKNVRRAEKRGVTVRVSPFDDDLVRGIAAVNDDSPVRQGVRNKHYGKSLSEVKRDEESFLDRSDFICAYRAGELVGFLKVVYRGQVASILNVASKVSQYESRPTNALIAKAVEVCIAKGMSHLTYGMFNYGNKRDSTLRQFKIRNGFEESLSPRFYVPLTLKGIIAVRLGLHRGLLGILPPVVINIGLRARSKWYQFAPYIRAGVAQR